MTNDPNQSQGDWGRSDLDPAEQELADLELEDPESASGEPWSPPDRQPRPAEYAEVEGEETLDQRIRQEEPEIGTAYGDPDDADTRPTPMAGGDDPDAIPAELDVLGGPAYEADDALQPGSQGPEGDAIHTVVDPDAESED